MATSLANTGRQLARKVLIFQSLVAVFVASLLTIFFGKSAGLSAIYGAVICLLPSLVFARLAFKYAGASQNQLVVRSFSQGAKFKLFLTIILFVVAFAALNAQPVPLFANFAATTAAQWVAMLTLATNDQNKG